VKKAKQTQSRRFKPITWTISALTDIGFTSLWWVLPTQQHTAAHQYSHVFMLIRIPTVLISATCIKAHSNFEVYRVSQLSWKVSNHITKVGPEIQLFHCHTDTQYTAIQQQAKKHWLQTYSKSHVSYPITFSVHTCEVKYRTVCFNTDARRQT